MAEKYIRTNRNSHTIVKSSKTYAKIKNLEDAILIRDLLVENDWDLSAIPQIIRDDENYIVLALLDEKIHLIAKYKTEPDAKTVDKLIKRHRRNPNNSRYGLNIARVFETFVIKKQIAGDDYIFGYYGSLEDATFVRNFLLDHSWNVNEFDEVNYCDESDSYKLVHVFDDKVYVLDSSKGDDFDLKRTYQEFVSKLYKHKYGLASYPHLDLLAGDIESVENELGVKAQDDMWSFDNVSESESPLNQIVFNLSPFEKSVYDSISGQTSFDEIKKSMVRYKSKNFEGKIRKNLDSLIERGLVEELDGSYQKTNL